MCLAEFNYVSSRVSWRNALYIHRRESLNTKYSKHTSRWQHCDEANVFNWKSTPIVSSLYTLVYESAARHFYVSIEIVAKTSESLESKSREWTRSERVALCWTETSDTLWWSLFRLAVRGKPMSASVPAVSRATASRMQYSGNITTIKRQWVDLITSLSDRCTSGCSGGRVHDGRGVLPITSAAQRRASEPGLWNTYFNLIS